MASSLSVRAGLGPVAPGPDRQRPLGPVGRDQPGPAEAHPVAQQHGVVHGPRPGAARPDGRSGPGWPARANDWPPRPLRGTPRSGRRGTARHAAAGAARAAGGRRLRTPMLSPVSSIARPTSRGSRGSRGVAGGSQDLARPEDVEGPGRGRELVDRAGRAELEVEVGAGPAGEDLERLVQAEQTGDRVRQLVGVDVGDRPQSATDEQLPVVAEQSTPSRLRRTSSSTKSRRGRPPARGAQRVPSGSGPRTAPPPWALTSTEGAPSSTLRRVLGRRAQQADQQPDVGGGLECHWTATQKRSPGASIASRVPSAAWATATKPGWVCTDW